MRIDLFDVATFLAVVISFFLFVAACIVLGLALSEVINYFLGV